MPTCHSTPTGCLLPLTTLLPVMDASKGPSPTMEFSTRPLGRGACTGHSSDAKLMEEVPILPRLIDYTALRAYNTMALLRTLLSPHASAVYSSFA